MRQRILLALFFLCSTCATPCLLMAGEVAESHAEAYDYIAWDLGRFARTEEQVEQHIRWMRDLGFTHSLIGVGNMNAGASRRLEQYFRLAHKYGVTVGYRLHFERDSAVMAEHLGLTRQEMIDRGILLSRQEPGNHPGYTPTHPAVIEYYTRKFTEIVDASLKIDPHRRLKMFLIGTEMGWPLPKTNEAAYPQALQQIYALARADGALHGEPNVPAEIGWWWSGSFTHGGDWRLRKSIEDSILERIGDARFWVDPTWSVKIVHGGGGDWSYVGGRPLRDPKNIADAVQKLKAVCRPHWTAHSTQLINGAFHDTILEGNLLSLAMGVDKLYHWGANKFEPGRTPYYGHKGPRSPKGFPVFHAFHVDYWDTLAQELWEKRTTSPYDRLWDRLDERLRMNIGAHATLKTDARDLRPALLAALNRVLEDTSFYDAESWNGLKVQDRAIELGRRHDQKPLEGPDLQEMNRLLLEPMFPIALKQTPENNILQRLETIARKRAQKEPALRATGRLLRERGSIFADWKPKGPRLAVLSGIYGGTIRNVTLMVAHIPFDILRSPRDRRELLPAYRHVLVGKAVGAEDYETLLNIEADGGTIYVPQGFMPPTGKPALKRPVIWDGPAERGQPARPDPAGWRSYLHDQARLVREVMSRGRFNAYFDSDDLDVILSSFEFRGVPVLFAVNDLRRCKRLTSIQDEGVAHEATFFVREPTDGLRVLNIDTGKDMALERTEDGWRFTDTLQPGWYGLYAVLKPGQQWEGPGPLPSGPAIRSFAARRHEDGVELQWRVDVEDWVGSDVQYIRMHRSSGSGDMQAIAEVYARPVKGPGGFLTRWVDETAEPGRRYSYRIQVVTPLRTLGPLSEAVKLPR